MGAILLRELTIPHNFMPQDRASPGAQRNPLAAALA
jgi:hypothetical protein